MTTDDLIVNDLAKAYENKLKHYMTVDEINDTLAKVDSIGKDKLRSRLIEGLNRSKSISEIAEESDVPFAVMDDLYKELKFKNYFSRKPVRFSHSRSAYEDSKVMDEDYLLDTYPDEYFEDMYKSSPKYELIRSKVKKIKKDGPKYLIRYMGSDINHPVSMLTDSLDINEFKTANDRFVRKLTAKVRSDCKVVDRHDNKIVYRKGEWK